MTCKETSAEIILCAFGSGHICRCGVYAGSGANESHKLYNRGPREFCTSCRDVCSERGSGSASSHAASGPHAEGREIHPPGVHRPCAACTCRWRLARCLNSQLLLLWSFEFPSSPLVASTCGVASSTCIEKLPVYGDVGERLVHGFHVLSSFWHVW